MKAILNILVPAALVALAACSDTGTTTTTGGTISAANDLCLASTWRDRFTGKTRAEAEFEIGPLIREGRARIVESGAARAERPDRLTFEMGRDDRVARISCG